MTRARDMANLGSQAGSGLDASDITTGTLGSGVTFPAGHVVNSSFDTTNTATVIASTTKGSGTSTTLTCAHTAKSATNKLWIHVNLQYYIYAGGGMGFGLEIHNGTSVVSTDTVITTNYFINYVSGSDAYVRTRYNYDCEINPLNTSAITYDVRLFKYDGTLKVQNDSCVSTISIQEIQG